MGGEAETLVSTSPWGARWWRCPWEMLAFQACPPDQGPGVLARCSGVGGATEARPLLDRNRVGN